MPPASTEPTSSGSDQALSSEELEHFVQRGFVRLQGAIASDRVEDWLRSVRDRVRRDPSKHVYECRTAKQRRALEEMEYENPIPEMGSRISALGVRKTPISELSPRAWAAACQLAGCASAWTDDSWGDYTILGNPRPSLRFAARLVPRRLIRRVFKWHVDDPRPDATATNTTVGLVPLILLSNIGPGEGATLLAGDSVRPIAEALRESHEPIDLDSREFCGPIFRRCSDIVEVTGEAGDVYLTHPFALHTGSAQVSHRLRVLSNPTMYLREPLDLTKTRDLTPIERACAPLGDTHNSGRS